VEGIDAHLVDRDFISAVLSTTEVMVVAHIELAGGDEHKAIGWRWPCDGSRSLMGLVDPRLGPACVFCRASPPPLAAFSVLGSQFLATQLPIAISVELPERGLSVLYLGRGDLTVAVRIKSQDQRVPRAALPTAFPLAASALPVSVSASLCARRGAESGEHHHSQTNQHPGRLHRGFSFLDLITHPDDSGLHCH